jgi:hypothetical protein
MNVSAAGRCASWPHCNAPPLPGDRFCETHRHHLDAVKAISGLGYKTRTLPASVTITHAPPEPTKARRHNRAQAGNFYRQRILDALAGGPLLSVALGAACDARPDDRTYSRARRGLLTDGSIIEANERQGRERRYSLAEASAV